jgi:prepilin-type processing-associated H-X9-DG protein
MVGKKRVVVQSASIVKSGTMNSSIDQVAEIPRKRRSARPAILAIALSVVAIVALAAISIATHENYLFGILFMVGWIAMLIGSISAAIRRRGLLSALLLFAFVVVLLALVDWGASPAAREAARRNSCANNLHEIGRALLEYESIHGGLPPQYTTDANAKPLHSWRTLILPFLEQNALSSAIHSDEAWDSPSNKIATQTKLEIFCCPSDKNELPSHTSYVAVLGPKTAWNGQQRTKLSDIKDGPANTILLIEMKSNIHWAEPRDVSLDDVSLDDRSKTLQSQHLIHDGGFNALFADGHVEFIPSTISRADLEAMLSIDGGEKVDREKWQVQR